MASSSFCHVTEIQHDVFISFRGTDVRRGLLSHLIKELRREQIDAYVDDRLERGDEISSSLLRAIEGSHVLLVIFSKDYASSKMCLKELVKMIECMERNKQIVIPVFYNVNPSDVRHQKGEYRDALAKHEGKFKEYMVKVQNWRSALEKAAELSGFHYPANFENESDLVDEIVKDVSKKLSKFYSSKSNGESNDLIGIDQNIAQIESLLAMESEEALMIGIWGMGGIGKTTIARATFDKYSLHYDGCSFLRIREEIEKKHLSCVHEKLLFELIGGKNLPTDGISKKRFFSDVKRRLSRKKVFIVLDDVNTSEQLKHLVGNPSFRSGSRVIITSRDRRVLTGGGVYRIHEVKELNPQESLTLFCLKAFNESQPKIGYEELSKKAIVNANGNPLALEVLGLDFHSRSKETWECAIRRLKKYPNEKIQSVLRFSYDGLDDIEKKAFLDIAFCFKGDDKDYVIRQLDAWDFYGASGIEVLQQKALITISNDNRIEMYDLIQEMAQKIVCEESPNPRRRSRLILRDKEEVYDALQNNREKYVVEAMLIDVSQIGDVPLSVDTFRKMPNLRFVKCYCPWHVDLFMPPSHVIELLQGVQFPKASVLECANLNNCHSLHDLVNLKTIDVSRSKQLMELPDLSEESNIERAYLLECDSLSDGHPSMLSLQTKVTSVLSGCKELMSNGIQIHIKSIDYLLIDGCSGPKEFSVSSKEKRQLNLTDTGVEILNSSIGRLSNLECSYMDGLQFKNLPSELFCLRSTYYLRLFNNHGQDTKKSKLHILFDGLRYSRQISLNELYNLLQRAVHQNISAITWLSELRLDRSNIRRFPAIIKHFPRLKILLLRRLCFLPELPRSDAYLDATNCTSQETEVGNLLHTDELPFLTSLKELYILRCVIEKHRLHILFDGSRTLRTLCLEYCHNLSELPDNINVLSQLRVLSLDGSRVEMLPVSIKHLLGLKELSLRGCRRLLSLPELPPSIQSLDAHDCILLETVEFSSTTAAPPEIQYADISFQNCASLDAEKFNHLYHQYVRALVHGYELRRTRTGAQEPKCKFVWPFVFCYPESRVPERFTYHGWGASVTIELALVSNYHFSCLLCIVLSSSSYPSTVQVKCQSYLEDSNMLRYATRKHSLGRIWMDLNSDHVYMRHSCCCGLLLREIKAIRDDQCTSSSYNPKVTFEFSLELEGGAIIPKHELDGLIRECGVCPLYLSDYHNFIVPKRRRDVSESEITKIGNGIGSPVTESHSLPRRNRRNWFNRYNLTCSL